MGARSTNPTQSFFDDFFRSGTDAVRPFVTFFAIAVSHQSSPYISVYSWTPGTGFGTKFANPLICKEIMNTLSIGILMQHLSHQDQFSIC